MDDLERRIFGQFDDATWFYPGHGNDSTLGAERPHLSDWRRVAGEDDEDGSHASPALSEGICPEAVTGAEGTIPTDAANRTSRRER